MTLLLLPTDLSDIDPQQPVFSSALKRSFNAPFLYRKPTYYQFSETEWRSLCSEGYPVLFIAGPVPSWVRQLLEQREIGILTGSEEIADSIGKAPGAHVGLLRGTQDLKEFYRVIQRLIENRVKTSGLSSEEDTFCDGY
jgi:hypothetical protein